MFNYTDKKDALNFGPEWLHRNLSDTGPGGATTTNSVKYQLSKYRYGREDMLGLFSKDVKPPESLDKTSSLYINQIQEPLAVICVREPHYQEDDNRYNSPWPRPQSSAAIRTRVVSMERGRNRGRGTTFQTVFSRSTSAYEEGGRPYDRTQPNWSERNGDVNDWGASTISPRKDLRSVGNDNWRKHRAEDDTDGWRSGHAPRPTIDRWGRSTSWRNDIEEEKYERGGINDKPINRNTWHSGGNGDEIPPYRRQEGGAFSGLNRRNWDGRGGSGEDHLPEWLTENAHDAGSFDASGAFLADEDAKQLNLADNGEYKLHRSSSDHSLSEKDRYHPLSTSQSAHALKSKMTRREDNNSPINDRNEISPGDANASPSPEISHKQTDRETAKQPKQQQHSERSSEQKGQTNDNERERRDAKVNNSDGSRVHSSNQNQVKKKVDDNTRQNEDTMERMQEVADDLVAKLVLDEESTPKSSISENNNISSSFSSNNANKNDSSQPHHQPVIDSSIIQSSLLSQQQAPVDKAHNNWYYTDPQGDVQGPFASSDMSEWLKTGYFVQTLMLRRQCDERFFTLGELVKLCGEDPFVASARLPPLKNESLSQIAMQNSIQPSSSSTSSSILGGLLPQPPTGQSNPAHMLDTDALQQQRVHLQLQTLQHQMMVRQAMAVQALSRTEPWDNLSQPQQQDLIAQHILAQPQVLPESPFITPLVGAQPNNPLMQMINQMQQQQKLGPVRQLMQQINHNGTANNQPNEMTNVPPLTSVSSLESQHLASMLHNAQSQNANNAQQQQSHSVPSSHSLPTHRIPLTHNLPPGQQRRVHGAINQTETDNNAIKQFLEAFQPHLQQQQQQQQAPPHFAGASNHLINARVGEVPGPLSLPPNLHQQVNNVKPNLQQPPPHQHLASNVDSFWSTQNSFPNIQTPWLRASSVDNAPHKDGNSIWSTPTDDAIISQQPASKLSNINFNVVPTTLESQVQQPPPPYEQKNLKNDFPIAGNNQHQPSQAKTTDATSKTPKQSRKKEQTDENKDSKEKQMESHDKDKKHHDDDTPPQTKRSKSKKSVDSTPEKTSNKTATKKQDSDKWRSSSQLNDDASNKNTKQKDDEKNVNVEKKRGESADKQKREAEEKRLRELEEKRRLKEQRKLDEENRRKADDKKVDDKKKDQEKPSAEDTPYKAGDELRKALDAPAKRSATNIKTAPWCTPEPAMLAPTQTTQTLAEIQKAEREKKAIEMAIEMQRQKDRSLREAQEQRAAAERGSLQLKWAATVALPKKVKSLAEIQAEEQEKQAKLAAEQRLTQLKEKKEVVIPTPSSIWSTANQSLTWGSNSVGFWDDKSISTASVATKVIVSQAKQPKGGIVKSQSAIIVNKQVNTLATTAIPSVNNKTAKMKAPSSSAALALNAAVKSNKKAAKKSDSSSFATSNGVDLGHDFSLWCTKTLSNVESDVHVPTFVDFLMEVESPYEVKDIVRTYLGESSHANEFAKQFLEKRSNVKQRNRAAQMHLDDMCMPAPAINPAVNNTEFQEVKGKNKKVKKSKMTKMDARCLGFSVTAAQDRINIGDRDYGDVA